MTKTIVFLDMDGVLADFERLITTPGDDPPEMFVPGFFKRLPVVPGARVGVAKLLASSDLSVYVATKHTTKALGCATEKLEWIAAEFPQLLRRVMLTCDKGLLLGDILVDDDRDRWKHKFKGRFMHFDRAHPELSWLAITEELTR